MTNDCKNINKFVMTIGQIPTSYLVSMTYEEQLLWLCNFLEKEIVPAITETTELVHQIKEYVDKYLTDVDEIKEQITQIFNDIFLLQFNIFSKGNDIDPNSIEWTEPIESQAPTGIYERTKFITNIEFDQLRA